MPVQYARPSLKTARLLLIPLGAALLAALCLPLYALRARVERSTAADWADASQRSSLQAGVESAVQENGVLVLTGWALDEGVQYDSYNWGNGGPVQGPWNDSRFALLDSTDGTLYLLPTQASEPAEDAAWLPQDGLNYGRPCLTSRVSLSKLPERAEICVTFTLPDGSRYLYHTGEEVRQ